MTFEETLQLRQEFCEERFSGFHSLHEALGKLHEEVREVETELFSKRNPCFEFLDVATVALSAAASCYERADPFACFFCNLPANEQRWNNEAICDKCAQKGQVRSKKARAKDILYKYQSVLRSGGHPEDVLAKALREVEDLL